MDFTNRELRIIRSALTDSLELIDMGVDDLKENDAESETILLATKLHEETMLALIEKISDALEAI